MIQKVVLFDLLALVHGRRQRGAGGPWPPPWIFKHGTNIVDRGLKVLFLGLFLLFFGLFSVFPLPGRD